MNETERSVAEAIREDNETEAIRLLVEATESGNTIIRLCPDGDPDHDFSITVEQERDYYRIGTITAMVRGYVGFIQI